MGHHPGKQFDTISDLLWPRVLLFQFTVQLGGQTLGVTLQNSLNVGRVEVCPDDQPHAAVAAHEC